MLSSPLLARIRRVALELHPTRLEALVTDLRRLDTTLNQGVVGSGFGREIGAITARQAVTELIDLWQAETPEVTGSVLAAALETAAYCQGAFRQELSVELVWTGPDAGGTALRRTGQVLLQLIQEATEYITLVCFAVYRVIEIGRALEAALERGVKVSIIVETPDASEGKIAFDGLPTLGQLILSQAQIFMWPLEKRPVDQEGRHGSLHAKCAIVDGRRIFISSANLTEFALNLNMEMGVLIESPDLAQQAEKHINHLITYGLLRQ